MIDSFFSHDIQAKQQKKGALAEETKPHSQSNKNQPTLEKPVHAVDAGDDPLLESFEIEVS